MKQALLKFNELIEKAGAAEQVRSQGIAENDDNAAERYFILFFDLKVSSINLLIRLCGEESVYVKYCRGKKNSANRIKAILTAARTDYQQGFVADQKLLISAEVFVDLLVQVEILLEHDYKDAAAVITRAVLEDGIRKLCEAHKIETGRRDTIQQLNEKLYKGAVYNALTHKEIIAKSEIGNCAAHARFDQYNKGDVVAFRDFVLRFLAQYLN